MRVSVPRLCYITDRRTLPAGLELLTLIGMATEAGVDMIQVREKDLPIRDQLSLLRSALEITGATATAVMVNDRLDAALGAGASGVHLGGESLPAAKVRAALGPAVESTFCVGVSCHSVAEVRAAEDAGASYVLLGPIFDTPSKRIYGPPLGLEVLTEAARNCQVPLLALGGITPTRVRACVEAGASGIAGISIFQRPEMSASRLQNLRQEITEAAERAG